MGRGRGRTMATGNLGGVAYLKLFNFQSKMSNIRYAGSGTSWNMKCDRVESSCLPRGVRMVGEPAPAAAFNGRGRKLTNPLSVCCLSEGITEENDADNAYNAHSKEKLSSKDQIVPSSLKVQSLLTTICDTTSIAEFELKLVGFRLYVKRDLVDRSIPAAAPTPPIAPTNTSNQTPEPNRSASASSLVISKPKLISRSIQSILETASDEGLVILQSPKVGFFRTSRTIKGKRAPPSCKEVDELVTSMLGDLITEQTNS